MAYSYDRTAGDVLPFPGRGGEDARDAAYRRLHDKLSQARSIAKDMQRDMGAAAAELRKVRQGRQALQSTLFLLRHKARRAGDMVETRLLDELIENTALEDKILDRLDAEYAAEAAVVFGGLAADMSY